MKYWLIIIVTAIFFLSPNGEVYAAGKPGKAAVSVPSISAQYIKARNSVRVFFGKLKGVKKVSYTLTYTAGGVGQGVMGSIFPGKKTSVSKDLYLGTCSGKVCVPHRNIKNIQLEVTTTFTNGKTSTTMIKVK